MKKTVPSTADARREAARKKDKQFIRDKENERKARSAKTEKLKQLRLAREASKLAVKQEAEAAKAAKKGGTARPKIKRSESRNEE